MEKLRFHDFSSVRIFDGDFRRHSVSGIGYEMMKGIAKIGIDDEAVFQASMRPAFPVFWKCWNGITAEICIHSSGE